MASSLSDDFECPDCGYEIHPNARSCKKCGAPTGPPRRSWDRPEHLDGIDPPQDPDFDYNDYLDREFGDTGDRPIVVDFRKVIWWLTAVFLFLVFLYLATR